MSWEVSLWSLEVLLQLTMVSVRVASEWFEVKSRARLASTSSAWMLGGEAVPAQSREERRCWKELSSR